MNYSLNLESEANLQGEFYHACRVLGMQVALEVETPAGRLDAAVLNKERTHLLAVVEVKPCATHFQGGTTPQIQRYKRLGLPVYGLSPANDPHSLAVTIKRCHATDPGVSMLSILAMQDIKQERRAQRNERKRQRFLRAL